MKRQIRISGFGGQGVIKCAYIIGKAASIYDSKNATMTQSFGPEARGSSCSAQVVMDDEAVLYPYLTSTDILVSMSQDSYRKYSPEVSDGGLILIDEDLVKPEKTRENIKLYSIPATRFAEEIGEKIVLNIIMFGFFVAMTGDLLNLEAAKKAVETSVPAASLELNMKAFYKGYDYGKALRETENKK
jgi:2-oxoglutarate ferredoxin oxidoreductase subunit gamma